jgi:hypothetical protein
MRHTGPLEALDQAGLDQKPVETARLGAGRAAVEPPLAAIEDLLLLGKGRVERQAGGLLDDQRQEGRLQRVERRRDVRRFKIDRVDG